MVKKPGNPVSVEDIIKFVESKVAPHKKLRGGVVFTDAIPKSASGSSYPLQVSAARKNIATFAESSSKTVV